MPIDTPSVPGASVKKRDPMDLVQLDLVQLSEKIAKSEGILRIICSLVNKGPNPKLIQYIHFLLLAYQKMNNRSLSGGQEDIIDTLNHISQIGEAYHPHAEAIKAILLRTSSPPATELKQLPVTSQKLVDDIVQELWKIIRCGTEMSIVSLGYTSLNYNPEDIKGMNDSLQKPSVWYTGIVPGEQEKKIIVSKSIFSPTQVIQGLFPSENGHHSLGVLLSSSVVNRVRSVFAKPDPNTNTALLIDDFCYQVKQLSEGIPQIFTNFSPIPNPKAPLQVMTGFIGLGYTTQKPGTIPWCIFGLMIHIKERNMLLSYGTINQQLQKIFDTTNTPKEQIEILYHVIRGLINNINPLLSKYLDTLHTRTTFPQIQSLPQSGLSLNPTQRKA